MLHKKFQANDLTNICKIKIVTQQKEQKLKYTNSGRTDTTWWKQTSGREGPVVEKS